MKTDIDLAEEQEAAHQAVEEFYPDDVPHDTGPSTSELVEQKRQYDREFPERIESLHQQIEEKAARQAQEAKQAEEAAPRWSDADVKDLTVYQQAVQRQDAGAQQFQVAYHQTLQEHGARNFEELQQKAPAVANQFADAYQTLVRGAEIIQIATERIEHNLANRQVEEARVEVFNEFPDLKDEAHKESFISWLEGQGYSREQILAERNPEIVKLAYRGFRAEQKSTPKGKIPKRKPGPKKAKHTLVDPRIKDTKIGRTQALMEEMYGIPDEPIRAPRKKLSRNDPVRVLYGEPA